MLRQYHNLLRCPNCQRPLRYRNKSLECVICKRTFPIFSDNLVELLPSKPYPLEKLVGKKYLATYIRLLGDKFEWNPLARGWGDLSRAPKGYKAFIKKERKVIEELLGKSLSGLFCDVSGGAGNYSLYYANVAKLVVHCDLDVNSINCVYERSKQCKLERALFVRCDYLQLPLASNTFDSIICMDTLERGYPHELRLLMEILRCLKPHGRFVVDFQNKSRIPCSSLFKMESENVGYDCNALQKIFSQFDLKNYKIKPIGHVPIGIVPFEKAYTSLDKMFQLFLVPSARWIIVGEKN